MATYHTFDETKMRECLQAVKNCVEQVNDTGGVHRMLKRIYNEYMSNTDFLPLSEHIDFCVDSQKSLSDRNDVFNDIYSEIYRLLEVMREAVTHVQKYEDPNTRNKEDVTKASKLIEDAEKLLNDVVGDMKLPELQAATDIEQDTADITLPKKIPETNPMEYKNIWAKDGPSNYITDVWSEHMGEEETLMHAFCASIDELW
jgi:hypothetical protein